MRFFLAITATIALCAPLAQAQEHQRYDLREHTGDYRGHQLGWSISGLGDANADGFDDYLIGTIDDDTIASNAGSVALHSGSTGAVLLEIYGTAQEEKLGMGLKPIGDYDQDGCPDFCVSSLQGPNAPNDAPTFQYRSGKTGQIFLEFHGRADEWGGNFFDMVGDLNGDGFPELLNGSANYDAQGNRDSGAATIYSGSDGSVLFRVEGSAPWKILGRSVCGLGDITGDGITDFTISQEYQVDFYSGSDFTLIRSLTSSNRQFGRATTAAGDADRDGTPDILIGDDRRAYVISGADGSTIYDWAFYEIGYHGCMSAGQDVNGDGFQDFVIGAPGSGPGGNGETGAIRVYSGLDGSRLAEFYGDDNLDYLGDSLTLMGDSNADGFADILIANYSEYHDGFFEAGVTRLVSILDDFRLDIVGLNPGSTATLTATNCRPHSIVYFLYSLSSDDWNWKTAYGFEIQLGLPIEQINFLPTGLGTTAELSVPVPSQAPVGLPVHFQAVELLEGGLFRTSNRNKKTL